MEVCPVCGDQRRNSARFCTTCGHRFATDEIVNAPVLAASPDLSSGPGDAIDPVSSGWPAPSSPVVASPWAPNVAESGGWPAPPAEPEAQRDSSEVTWAEVAATALGAPRKAQPTAFPAAEPETPDDFDIVVDADADSVEPAARSDDLLRQRARSLMSELQEVIEGLTGESASAHDDLADELEISLTRPVGLDGEALSDLRGAAESAQARPRDLDTITALTAQAETILALIVGYERATAGIERAIETLRSGPAQPDDQGVPVGSPLPS